MSGFAKTLLSGSAGSVTISEAGGIAKLVVSGSISAGGGAIAGVAKATLSAEVDLSAKELIDAALALIAVKVPTAAGLIAGIQAVVDAELAAN